MNPQGIGRAADLAERGLAENPGVDDQRTIGAEGVKCSLNRLCGGTGAHEQDHGEMTAQQRHRRVLEVAAEAGQRPGHVRNDAGPVVPEHGHGDDLVCHGVDVIATPSFRRLRGGR